MKEDQNGIETLAKIAWEYKLRSEKSGFSEHNLARPLTVCFKILSQTKPGTFSHDELKAMCTQAIIDYLDRTNPTYFGKTKIHGAKEFVNIFFSEIVGNRFDDNIENMLRNNKKIKLAYMYYISNQKKQINGEQS